MIRHIMNRYVKFRHIQYDDIYVVLSGELSAYFIGIWQDELCILQALLVNVNKCNCAY